MKIPVLALVALVGCSLDSQMHGGPFAANTVAPGISAAIPPAIAVNAPSPGSWLAANSATLAGRVAAPSGLAVVSLVAAGVPATLRPDGTFQVTVQLGSGIASVLLVATDAAGTAFATTVSYMVGPFAPFQEVPGAARIRINPSGLPALDRDIAKELDTLDVTALLATLNPLPVKVLGGAVAVWVEFVSAAHGPTQVQLALAANELDASVVVPGAVVSVVVHDGTNALVPIQIPAVLTATVDATVAATFSSSAGVAQATLGPASVTIQGLGIQTSGTLDQVLAALVLSTVRDALVKAVEKLIAKHVPPIIDRTLGGLGKPLSVSVGPATLDVSFRAESIAADPGGLEISVAAVASPSGVTPRGYPTLATSPPVLSTARDVSIAIATDFLSEALVALQAAGALDLDIDATSWPATLGTLDLQTIGALIPELANVGSASTPVVLRVRPALPPLLEVGPGPAPFTLALGEVRIEILADSGGALTPLLGVAAHARVPVALSVQGSSLLVSTGSTLPTVDWSVVDQPVVRVDETRVQVRLAVLLDAILPKLLARLSSIPLPATIGSVVDQVDVGATGTGFDNLTVSGDLR